MTKSVKLSNENLREKMENDFIRKKNYYIRVKKMILNLKNLRRNIIFFFFHFVQHSNSWIQNDGVFLQCMQREKKMFNHYPMIECYDRHNVDIPLLRLFYPCLNITFLYSVSIWIQMLAVLLLIEIGKNNSD